MKTYKAIYNKEDISFTTDVEPRIHSFLEISKIFEGVRNPCFQVFECDITGVEGENWINIDGKILSDNIEYVKEIKDFSEWFKYDERGNLTYRKYSQDKWVTTEYNYKDREIIRQDSIGNKWRAKYDANGKCLNFETTDSKFY